MMLLDLVYGPNGKQKTKKHTTRHQTDDKVAVCYRKDRITCPGWEWGGCGARGDQLERLLCGKDAEAEEEATQEPNEGPQGEVPSEPLMSPNVLIFPPQSQNLK